MSGRRRTSRYTRATRTRRARRRSHCFRRTCGDEAPFQSTPLWNERYGSTLDEDRAGVEKVKTSALHVLLRFRTGLGGDDGDVALPATTPPRNARYGVAPASSMSPIAFSTT